MYTNKHRITKRIFLKPAVLNRWLCLYLLIFLTVGCTQERDKHQAFTLPHIFQYNNGLQNNLSYIKSDCIEDASAFFVDKFKFNDTVKIYNDGEVNTLQDND